MSITGDVIFCDDIRHEISGKAILVGCYGPTMRLGGPTPAMIERLILACRIYIPAKEIPKTAVGLVFFPQSVDEPDVTGDIELPPPLSEEEAKSITKAEERFEPRYVVTFQIELTNFDVEKSGFLRVRAQCDDEYVRLGDLRIVGEDRLEITADQ